MANFARLRLPGFWVLGSAVDPEEFEQLDAMRPMLINAAGGSTHSPSDVITIGGAGMAITGPCDLEDVRGLVLTNAGNFTMSGGTSMTVEGGADIDLEGAINVLSGGAIAFASGSTLAQNLGATWTLDGMARSRRLHLGRSKLAEAREPHGNASKVAPRIPWLHRRSGINCSSRHGGQQRHTLGQLPADEGRSECVQLPCRARRASTWGDAQQRNRVNARERRQSDTDAANVPCGSMAEKRCVRQLECNGRRRAHRRELDGAGRRHRNRLHD